LPNISAADPAQAAAPFRALAGSTGRALLTRLSGGGGSSIASLSADSGVSRQAATKHLRVLGRTGLVGSGRTGRETRFVRKRWRRLGTISIGW
jgi:DNA-binding transcriptional ArsR family regulator